MSVRLSVCPSDRLSVCLSLKISVTTEPIGFYSSGYIPIGPVVVLSYFLGGWDTPNPPKNKKNPPHFFCKKYPWSFVEDFLCGRFPLWNIFFYKFHLTLFLPSLGAKPLEARGEAASYVQSISYYKDQRLRP